jgi:hypothetical protein
LALGGEFGPNSPGYGRSSFISSTLTSGLVSCIDMARGAMLSLILLLVQYDVRLARGRDYTLLAVDGMCTSEPIRYIANNR